jgi:uncharacterized protein
MTGLTCLRDLPDQERRDAQAIRHHLGDGPVGVAFSGGVDSAVLLAVAHQSLGPEGAVGILAVSPSLASSERVTANRVARTIGADLIELETSELDDPAYAANPTDRCYFCKDELFTRIDNAFLRTHRLRAVAYGENADDQARLDRPGSRAATEHRVLRPLAAAGLGKARVRNLARELGLEVADKPASPCLASRIPHGEPVTAEKLAAIETAEAAVRRLGFSDCRVRHHGSIARIELPEVEIPRATEPGTRARLIAEVKDAGFRHVTIDLRGLQSGAFTLQVLGRHV